MVIKVTLRFIKDDLLPQDIIISSRFPMKITYTNSTIELKNEDTWLLFQRHELERLEAECLV